MARNREDAVYKRENVVDKRKNSVCKRENQNMRRKKQLLILGAALVLSAQGSFPAAALENSMSEENHAQESGVFAETQAWETICGTETEASLSEATRSEAVNHFEKLHRNLPGTVSTPSRALSGPLSAARSLAIDDWFVPESDFSRSFPELEVNISKNAAGNLVFDITGRVQGPYRTTDTSYHFYWGPYMGFTLYGVKGEIGMKGGTEDRNAKQVVRIAPEQYHIYPTSSEYDLRRFINQTSVITAHQYTPRSGGKLTAYVSPTHTEGCENCKYERIEIADVVSYSDNTPAEEQNGSSAHDLHIRMELANLNENVTGFYVGKYEYGYYSGSGTDKNANYKISTEVLDLSEALQSARQDKVRLTFDPGAGSGGPGTVELKPGASYTPSAPKPPAGQRFLRWDGWNGTVPSQAQTYRAAYEEIRYHIRFDAAGGSSVQDLRDLSYSALQQLPQSTKKGYRHIAWQVVGA